MKKKFSLIPALTFAFATAIFPSSYNPDNGFPTPTSAPSVAAKWHASPDTIEEALGSPGLVSAESHDVERFIQDVY
jgi:hypothetical protein